MGKEIPATKRELIYNKFGGKCAYCGCEILKTNFHVDHITALYRGTPQHMLKTKKGTSHIDNLNPSCVSCNSSKSTYSIEQWRSELELKTKRLIRDIPSFRILRRFGIIEIVEKKIVFYFETFTKDPF